MKTGADGAKYEMGEEQSDGHFRLEHGQTVRSFRRSRHRVTIRGPGGKMSQQISLGRSRDAGRSRKGVSIPITVVPWSAEV